MLVGRRRIGTGGGPQGPKSPDPGRSGRTRQFLDGFLDKVRPLHSGGSPAPEVTLKETPDDTSTHWTTRTLADWMGVGKDTVRRVWADHNLKPWKVEDFKVSNHPRCWLPGQVTPWRRPSGRGSAARARSRPPLGHAQRRSSVSFVQSRLLSRGLAIGPQHLDEGRTIRGSREN